MRNLGPPARKLHEVERQQIFWKISLLITLKRGRNRKWNFPFNWICQNLNSQFIAIKQFFETSVKIGRCLISEICTKNIYFFNAKKLFTIHNFFKSNYFILMHENYCDYTCRRWAAFFPSAKRSIRVMKHELPFSVDSIPIDVRIHTFLNKTLQTISSLSFPLVQFLLIILSVKVTYGRNNV